MAKTHGAEANGFVRAMRKIYHPLGFTTGYNFVLFFIFGGAFFAFSLSRFEFLNIQQIACNPKSKPADAFGPGECFWYDNFTRYHVGLIIHLATILPAGLLVVFQFVPVIRHRLIAYHRWAGRFIVLLAFISTGAAFAITDESFGGTTAEMLLIGTLGASFLIALTLALLNIRRLQIDQHRIWMMRAWFWAASIITLRIVMFIMAAIISQNPGGKTYVDAVPCPQLKYLMQTSNSSVFGLDEAGLNAAVDSRYPTCTGAEDDLNTYAVVRARITGATGPEQAAAVLHLCFGTAGWFAWLLHAVGLEIYFKLTTRESNRLRAISYQKQLAAGMKNPGNAGLTAERFGDNTPWVPPSDNHPKEKTDSAAAGVPSGHDSDDTHLDAETARPMAHR